MKLLDGKLIGKRVRAIRSSKNMTQEKLAESANVSLALISSLENQGRNITIDTLGKLINSLEISYTDFFSVFDYEDKDIADVIQFITTSKYKDEYLAVFKSIINLPSDDLD